jgi:hypothetical protein
MAAQGSPAAPLRVHSAAADVKAATIRAFMAGKAVLHEPGYATADYSGRCERPIIIDRIGVGHELLSRPIHGADAAPIGFEREKPHTLSYAVRCRRCPSCMRERQWMWSERAAKEWRESTRTWLVTLTFRPAEHFKMLAQTRQRLEATGQSLEAMDPKQRLQETLKEYRNAMRLYVNRLRVGLVKKGWNTLQFRYMWVPEPHKNGHIHFHMLLHEVSQDMKIPARRIEGLWGFGFVKAKELKTEGGARYACKYLGKHHFEGRLIASKHYGELPNEDDAARFAERVYPGHRAGVAPVIGAAEADARDVQEHMDGVKAALSEEPADGDERPCPVGLHFGVRCECEPAKEAESDPFGIDAIPLNIRGIPERRFVLRGWEVPDHLKRRRTKAGQDA